MTDIEQAAYDAATNKMAKMQTDLEYYRKLASYWHDIAYMLMSVENLRDDHQQESDAE